VAFLAFFQPKSRPMNIKPYTKYLTPRNIKLAVIALVVIVIIGLITGYSYSTKKFSGETTRIFIPANSTNEAISDTLTKNLGEKFGGHVYRLWTAQDGTAEKAHGSYVITPGEKAISVSRAMCFNRQTPVRLTFNNLRTVDQLVERIATVLELNEAEINHAIDSILPEKGYNTATYPAAFMPDTYEFYWTASAAKVIDQLVEYRDKFWTQERQNKAKSLNLSPVQVTTIASIVEEETAKADERSKVARLYLNRLDKGMKLQADPTVKFAVGDFTIRRITGAHLSVDSPYNTYKVNGVPPGPIRIVERTTIDDVLNAPAHDYMYMCAKEDFSGYHNFAKDFATHQANANRYQAELNKRNIK
jgi:UPF0755 protein